MDSRESTDFLCNRISKSIINIANAFQVQISEQRRYGHPLTQCQPADPGRRTFVFIGVRNANQLHGSSEQAALAQEWMRSNKGFERALAKQASKDPHGDLAVARGGRSQN